MDTLTERGLGDNRPPSDAEILQSKLADQHVRLTGRRDELLAAAGRAPETIEDDETAGRVADFIKQLMAAHKATEAARVAEKEPFLAASRTVDGFFKKITDPLADWKKKIETRLTVWQRKKADAERKAREETERKAREEAARAAKEAAERAAALNTESDLDRAIEAEDAAKKAEGAAALATKAADAGAADLSRTRGDFGAVASLRTTWTFDEMDRAALDLETLRQHFPQDGLEKAVRSYIKAGGRELRGVRIFADEHAVVV